MILLDQKNWYYLSRKNLISDFTALENIYLFHQTINDKRKTKIKELKKLIKKIGLSNRSNHFPSDFQVVKTKE